MMPAAKSDSNWVRKKVGARRQANMPDYKKACRKFRWVDVEKKFDWHRTGQMNVVHECVDRHADNPYTSQKLAFIYWEPNPQNSSAIDRLEKYSFSDLKILCSKAGNLLKLHRIKKGDRVAIFLPRSPELYFAYLGANRIGAIPVPLFEAFMQEALFDRLENSAAKALITTTTMLERVPLDKLSQLHTIFLAYLKPQDEATLAQFRQKYPRVKFVDYDSSFNQAPESCPCVWLKKDDGLVIHYTSGSTGRSKGILHRQYAMLGHYQTTLWTLDLKPGDVYWCTADPGWVTGTSYGIYGPWLVGATNLVLGGRFDAETWYRAIEKFRVSVWYSAPTAYRMLMSKGDELARKYRFNSLRHICSVGEPLNPEALRWIWKITGVAPHETWWMTETGMHIICNYISEDFEVGCTGKSFPGTQVEILDDKGQVLKAGQLGNLAVKSPWPSLMWSVYKNPSKYKEYFRFKGWYLSGDSASKDKDGVVWFSGRQDDVIKTAGERVGPFEVESALVGHPAVAEAGVIGKPDALRGHIIKAYISLRPGYQCSETLKQEIMLYVKKNMAAHAAPKEIDFCDKLPKTRSGKIMRRVLRCWDQGVAVTDVSTMED